MILVFVLPVGMIPPAVEATETVSVENTGVTVEGTNGFGDLISDGLADAQAQREIGEEDDSGGYGITALTIENNVATVTYEAMEEATLFVAIYTEDGMQLVNSGKTTVSADATQAQVTLEGKSPDYFEASAFLLDSYDLSPLCAAYNTPMYTQAMQKLLDSTVSTYEEDGYEVLNLDEDQATNFAVYNKSVAVIDYVEGYNTVTTIDEENFTYVIENCDEQITSLTAGMILAYPYGEESLLLIKIKAMEVVNGTATIYGMQMDIAEVFDYLKIETANNTGQGVVVDASACSEGVTFEGVKTEQAPATRALQDTITFRDYMMYSLSVDFMTPGTNQVGASIKGSLNVLPKATLSYYISTGRQFVETTAEIQAIASVTFTGTLKTTSIQLGEFELPSPIMGVKFECKPHVVWQFDISAYFNFTYTASFGASWDSKKGWLDLSKKTSYDTDTTMDGKVFIGLEIESDVDVIEAMELGFTLRDGVQITGVMGGTEHDGEPKSSASKIHTCRSCLGMSFDRVKQMSIWVKLLGHIKLEYAFPDITNHLGDMYWSISSDNPGSAFGKCPNYIYRANVKVMDIAGDVVPDQEVVVWRIGGNTPVGQGKTNEKGIYSIYLPRGQYVFKTYLNGSELNNTREIKYATRVVLTNNPDYKAQMEALSKIQIIGPSILVNSLFSKAKGGQGTFASGLTWKIYRSGTMVIEGDGAMDNYSSDNKVPWESLREKITGVIFKGDITNVGNYAFYGCTNLKTVILADATTDIGANAFYNCTSLAEIRIPVDYKYKPSSFAGCKNVEKIQYRFGQEGVMTNRQNRNLREDYYYRDSLEYISRDSLHTVIFEEGIANVGSFAFCETTALEMVAMYDGIETIGESAFRGSGIKTISLPDSLLTIEMDAFADSGLTQIEFPDSLETIGGYAFSNCYGLTELVIPDLLGQGIGASAFSNCTGLKRVTLPVDYILHNYCAFNGCVNVESIYYTCGETGVMTDRQRDTYNGNGYYTKTLEAICGNKLHTVVFDEGITRIGNYAFNDCKALTMVELPSTLLSIGQWAFRNTTGLQTIALPEGLQTIESDAFANSGLTEISFPETLETIGGYAFSGCLALTELVIPDQLNDGLGSGAFQYCSNLTKVTLPADYRVLEYSSFDGCTNVQTIVYTPGTTGVLTDRQRSTYGEDGYYTYSLEYISREKLQTVVFDDSIIRVGDYAFVDSTALRNVYLPKNLLSIGEWGFYNSGLQLLQLPDRLQTIGPSAFADCGLTQIQLPDSLGSIEGYAFRNCNNLTEITIPNHLGDNLGNGVFEYCTGLTRVTMPADCKVHVYGIFDGCTNVQTIHYTCGETGILTDRQRNSLRIEGFYTHALPYISREKLTSVTFDEGITRIGDYAFTECVALTNVQLPATLLSFGEWVFYNSGVAELTVPPLVEQIDYEAFSTASLKTIYFTGDAPSIHNYGMRGVTATVYYPEGNDTWTEDKMLNYDGALTWGSYTPATTVPAEKTVAEKRQTAAETVNTSAEEPEPTLPAVTTKTQTNKPAQKGVFSGQYSSVEIEEKVVHTAAFTELVPGAEYVVIAIIDPAAEDILALNNLLAIRQGTAGEDGSLMTDYIQRQAQDVSYVFAAGATHWDLNDAVITFPPMTENGQPQDIQPTVVYNGEVLLEEVDYVIVGDVDYTDSGEYTCYIRGVREYTGLVECRYTVSQANVNGWNITLGDNVAVNFRVAISDAVAEKATATVTAVGKTETITFQNAKKDAATGEWLFTVELAAAQMTEEILLEVTAGDTQLLSKTYSVRGYADYVLDDANGFDETTKALVTEMLHYGGAAQQYFGCNTDSFADAGIDDGLQTVLPEEDPSPVWVGNYPEGWSLYGVTMLFESRIALRFYYTADADVKLTVNGEKPEPMKKDGMYYIQVDDIAPHQLANPVQLQVNNTTCVVYSPMNYIIRMYQKTNDAALQQLLLAMYRYHLAALAYCE